MESIAAQIAPTFGELLEELQTFTPQTFNEIPFKGSWTGGQCARHIQLSVGTISDVLQGKTQPSGRDADQKVAQIAEVFLNFETKMKSPDFILPEAKTYRVEDFTRFFRDFSQELQLLADSLDLSEICLAFELPGFGPMTRLEWIAFVLCHTQRHTRQLRNIAGEVSA